MNSKIKLTDAQRIAFYQVYKNRHDEAGYYPAYGSGISIATVDALRKREIVKPHDVNPYRFVLTAGGAALADELFGGQWIVDLFGAIDTLYRRQQDRQRERELRASIYSRHPFIPQHATVHCRYDETIQSIDLDWVEVVKHHSRGVYVVRPTCSAMMEEEDAIEMSAQLLTAVSIAQQLNAALESERAIQEGA